MAHHYDEDNNLHNSNVRSTPLSPTENIGPDLAGVSGVYDPNRDLPPEALAKRDPRQTRYDLLYPTFLYAMAQIANYGATHYGDGNWMKSRLTGEKGAINHIYEHLGNYQCEAAYDHKEIGTHRMYHLAAIAFNAMMEFYYEDHETK